MKTAGVLCVLLLSVAVECIFFEGARSIVGRMTASVATDVKNNVYSQQDALKLIRGGSKGDFTL